jgi:hypothetical protein
MRLAAGKHDGRIISARANWELGDSVTAVDGNRG